MPTSAKTRDAGGMPWGRHPPTHNPQPSTANSHFCGKRRGRPRDAAPAAAHADKKKVKCPVCGDDMAKNTLKKHHLWTFAKQDKSVDHLVPDGNFSTSKFSRKLA